MPTLVTYFLIVIRELFCILKRKLTRSFIVGYLLHDVMEILDYPSDLPLETSILAFLRFGLVIHSHISTKI